MKKKELSEEDLSLINSKIGLEVLFRNKKINIKETLEEIKYEIELKSLQVELINLHNWVIDNNKKVVILFEGRDAAGKGGAIRRTTEFINPRQIKIVALDIPTDDEKHQWFFQRYIQHLPKPGEIVFYNRSWYNRAVVEPVNGFCTAKDYQIFMNQVNDFEKMLVESDTYLIKFYFSITKKEQAKRFSQIKKTPLKRWRITEVDERAQELWDQYTFYKEEMFRLTNTTIAPWVVIDANIKMKARTQAIAHILKTIPYK